MVGFNILKLNVVTYKVMWRGYNSFVSHYLDRLTESNILALIKGLVPTKTGLTIEGIEISVVEVG